MDNLKMRESLAEWVDQFDWQFYFTGTFPPDRSYRDAIKTKRAFERFAGDLRNNYGKNHIEYFMAVERFKHGDFTHVHALLNGLDGCTYPQIGGTWRARFKGIEQVEGYDPEKGAAFYLTKYVCKSICDWDLHIIKTKSHIFEGKRNTDQLNKSGKIDG